MTPPPFVSGTVVTRGSEDAASLPPKIVTSCRGPMPRSSWLTLVPIPPQIRPYSGAATAIFVASLSQICSNARNHVRDHARENRGLRRRGSRGGRVFFFALELQEFASI